MIRPLAGLIVLLAPGAASAAPLTADGFLATFTTACLEGYRSPEARQAAIAAAGWKPIADDASPMLARMLAISRQSLVDAEREDGYTGSADVYGRRDGGESPYLVTTTLNIPDDGEGAIDLLGCYLYDFDADAPLDPGLVSTRFDEVPAEIEDQEGVIVSHAWQIESLPGVWELRSTFIPAGSPGVDVTGFSGRVLILTSEEG
ncbi:MAG: hypothetical protein J0H08_03040 [Rhizobiales bacterium]|nr:hypothetical protein [Hyphomicrobiales bacterium]